MSQEALDDLQARIDSLRSRLLTSTADKSMAHTPAEVPAPLLELKCRRSWTFGPVAIAAAVLALLEAAAFAITGHGFGSGFGLFLCLAWWPWMANNGELRVRDVGIEIPYVADWTTGPFADLLRANRPQLLSGSGRGMGAD